MKFYIHEEGDHFVVVDKGVSYWFTLSFLTDLIGPLNACIHNYVLKGNMEGYIPGEPVNVGSGFVEVTPNDIL